MNAVEECYRSSAVRVFRLKAEAIVTGLRARAADLLAHRPEVQQVRLFGSFSRGSATPGSDVDILLVLAESATRFIDRIPDYTRYFAGMGIACDVLPYTERELEALRAEGAPFILTAWNEGIVLAGRARD